MVLLIWLVKTPRAVHKDFWVKCLLSSCKVEVAFRHCLKPVCYNYEWFTVMGKLYDLVIVEKAKRVATRIGFLRMQRETTLSELTEIHRNNK